MDIQTSIFPSGNTLNQKRIGGEVATHSTVTEGTSEPTKPTNRQVGQQSVELIERLSRKMAQQLEQPDRVAAIKAEMANGTFKVDTGAIADQLLWGERIAALSERS